MFCTEINQDGKLASNEILMKLQIDYQGNTDNHLFQTDNLKQCSYSKKY